MNLVGISLFQSKSILRSSPEGISFTLKLLLLKFKKKINLLSYFPDLLIINF